MWNEVDSNHHPWIFSPVRSDHLRYHSIGGKIGIKPNFKFFAVNNLIRIFSQPIENFFPYCGAKRSRTVACRFSVYRTISRSITTYTIAPYGVQGRFRSDYLLIHSQMLSQLSYKHHLICQPEGNRTPVVRDSQSRPELHHGLLEGCI